MAKRIYKASKTRSNRPGYSVAFRHPLRRDSRGHYGLKVRRGLGTSDERRADRLVKQLNELLSDQAWWNADKRQEAARQFSEVVVGAFFDGIEAGRVNTHQLRDARIPLPTPDDGYARIFLVGTTGAGKTTLLRHLIGSDHHRDRFPSTSTARTTTADIEIVSADGAFEGVVTFMPEHEVRAHVDECLEEACLSAIQVETDTKIAGNLLSHREQRFRLSYILGTWADQSDGDDDEFRFEDEEPESDDIEESEAVDRKESAQNRKLLKEYIERIKELSLNAAGAISESVGTLDELDDPEDRASWLELFGDALHDHEAFARLALDLLDDIEDRFSLIKLGAFENSPTGWPVAWSFSEPSRGEFLKQLRWFSSNHHRQFGRLLTPLVDGIRAKGPFKPQIDDLRVADQLVLIDGEGIGHSTKTTSSVSTRVTKRFSQVDMILLIDNAEQPMQAAPIELLRTIGNSGHADKLAVAFTHFDMVKGKNFGTFQQKRDHVMLSVQDSVATLRQSVGAPVAAMLEKRIQHHAFFLGGLDREIEKIPSGFRNQLANLLTAMRRAANPSAPADSAPVYSVEGLEIALRDAAVGFLGPWKGRLGLEYHDGIAKEHWTRIKALARRFANAWSNEYDTLRPVADFVASLQENISRWLDSPTTWTRRPKNDDQRHAALAPIRKAVFVALHDLAEDRLANAHRSDWRDALDFAGTGSSFQRAEEIDRIYREASPLISSAMSSSSRKFLHELHRLIRTSIEEAGGIFASESYRDSG